MNAFKNPEKRKGIIGTLLFHVALLLLFLFVGLTHTIPRPEQGIRINFGNSAQGKGVKEAQTALNTKDAVEHEKPESPRETMRDAKEKVLVQDVEETLKLPEEKEAELVEEEQLEEEEPELDEALKKVLAKAFSATKELGSEGETAGKENQGNPDGSEWATSREGGALNGVNYSLAGRKMLSVPQIADDEQEEGKIVVEIIVDRYGNVIRATPGAVGTTISSGNLFKKTKDAALRAKFSPNTSGSVEQRGELIFVFILK